MKSSSPGTGLWQLSGGVLLGAFGLPFLALGGWVLAMGLQDLAQHRAVQSWAEAEALIRKVDRQTRRNSKSTTHRITATYEYEFAGTRHTGHRIEIGREGATDDSSASRYTWLEDARAAGHPVPVWVDPSSPGSSVLFRELPGDVSLKIPFGLCFALVGGLIVFAGIWMVHDGVLREIRRRRHPEQPWRQEVPHPGFVIRPGTGAGLLVGWSVAIAFACFTLTFQLGLAHEAGAPLAVRILVGLFCLAGLAGLGGAAHATIRTLKYGSPELELVRLPLEVGSETMCELRIPRLVDAPDLELTLRCVSVTRRNKKDLVENLHEHRQKVTIGRSVVRPGVTAVRFPLSIPTGHPPRTDVTSGTVRWTLAIEASTPGVDFSTYFSDLPVHELSSPRLAELNPRVL